mgnify:CR=1 FL=1
MRKTMTILLFSLTALAIQAQKPFSFFSKAGIGTSHFWGKNSSSDTKVAYKAGVGTTYTINRTWALQSSINFLSIGGKDEIEYTGSATMNELYLQLPVLITARVNLGKDYHASLGVGPYIAYGIGGTTSGEMEYDYDGQYQQGSFKYNTFGNMYDGNMGNYRFDTGVSLELSLEYRKFIFGAEMQMGLMRINEQLNQLLDSDWQEDYFPKNFSLFFTVGYRLF